MDEIAPEYDVVVLGTGWFPNPAQGGVKYSSTDDVQD